MKTIEKKTTEVVPAAASEECGVWLDATELRAKKRQKRLVRPISKVLNPLARSGGYSMAVALSFTQTKMKMPATKQSTISAFFLPQSEVSKDTEERSSSLPSESSSTPLPEPHLGTKRKHAMTTDLQEANNKTSHTSQVHSQEIDADLESESVEICKDRKKEQHFFRLIWGYQSEEPEPAEKRRLPEDAAFENNTQTLKESNQATFHRCRMMDEIQDKPETLHYNVQVQQDSVHQDSPCNQLHRSSFRANSSGSSASLSAEDVQWQENLRACAVMHRNTCQKPVLTTRSGAEKHTAKHSQNPHKELEISVQKQNYTQRSHVKRKDKENIGPTSPTRDTGVPPVNRLPSPSPVKCFSNFEKPSVFERVKLYQSAKKSLENEQDSFAMLFTQDSEGFRVIANSSQQTRCALKDRTNSTEDRENWNLPPVKCLEMEEDSQVEPEVLFTQDSQGNLVIRH
ncbi:aurora kinase A and ninein-interacting protein isoform X1 [Pygocentrus nattereri]|uniref:aurora kinase A and ninein-interacting protein isoform X1 n=2 Tax=Pygocentrus nattereri TaxID=42514 RepID=UPI0008142A8C|nr:aurora kinase A and ninein-interacting protein isoform X1 [Pygocentrus nattereri]